MEKDNKVNSSKNYKNKNNKGKKNNKNNNKNNYKNNTSNNKYKNNKKKVKNEVKINLDEDIKENIKEEKLIKKPKKVKMRLWIKIVIFLFFLIVLLSILFVFRKEITSFVDKIKEGSKETIKEVINYNDYFFDTVKLKEDKTLYKLEDNKFLEAGLIKKDLVLELIETENNEKGYFKLKDFDFYIDYKDLEEYINTEEEETSSPTYTNYVPFNESIKTKEKTNFYLNDNLEFTLNESMDFPIIIKDTNYYGIIYRDKLYYIKKDEAEVYKNNNTNLKYTSGIAALVYHYVYDSSDIEEAEKCKSWNTTICLSDKQFKEHMSYLKDNGFYTATMNDISLFIDGKIRLPEKTVLITIDDGYFTKASIKVLEELNMHATIFLIGVVGNPDNYKSPSIELHSHSYDMHKTGVCPGGQGGPIKCMARDKILEDLRKSREQLNGSTVFCYPFFEYNDYAISLLKEAGFEMAFIGGRTKIKVGSDKYKLPRYGIINTTYVSDIKKIVN